MKKANIALLLVAALSLPSRAETSSGQPNVLWIFAEDTSPWMGCYGDVVNAEATPNIDSLASAGVLFRRAFVPAPVCSACRSAMMAHDATENPASTRSTNLAIGPDSMTSRQTLRRSGDAANKMAITCTLLKDQGMLSQPKLSVKTRRQDRCSTPFAFDNSSSSTT